MFEFGLYHTFRRFERDLAEFTEMQRRREQQAWRTGDRERIRKMQPPA